jgi:hypothetical protein
MNCKGGLSNRNVRRVIEYSLHGSLKFMPGTVETVSHGGVVRTSSSYSGGSKFISQHGDQLRLRFRMVFFCPSG